jgi:hypothetical protein
MQDKSLRLVPRPDDLHRIARHLGRRRDLGQELAVRTSEPKLAIRLSIDLVALLVHGAMVPATEQREIRERRGAALGPVTNVMALAEPDTAPRETAAAIAMVQRPP